MEVARKGIKRKMFGSILVMLSGLDYMLAVKGNFKMPVFTIALFCIGMVLFIWGTVAQDKATRADNLTGQPNS